MWFQNYKQCHNSLIVYITKNTADFPQIRFFLFAILKEMILIMDLQQIYDKIGQYALNTQGVVKYTIGDCYVNWNALNMQYGAFNAILNYAEYQDNVIALHFTFYYGDKLANDSSNVYDAQTTGFKVIRNVVSHLENDFEMEGIEYVQIYPFWQKFADVLAGAYADVVLYAPIDENCIDFDKE